VFRGQFYPRYPLAAAGRMAARPNEPSMTKLQGICVGRRSVSRNALNLSFGFLHFFVRSTFPLRHFSHPCRPWAFVVQKTGRKSTENEINFLDAFAPA
jgi:hypothetical protein